MAQEEYRSRPQERPPARPQSGSREVPAGQGGGRRRRRRRGLGVLGALLYVVFVLGASALLAALGWTWACDVLALNKAEHSAVITLPSEIFSQEEREVEKTAADGTAVAASETVLAADMDYVADQLERQGLIEYKFVFKLFAAFTHARYKLSPGTYELNTDMDYRALLASMGRSSSSRLVTTVTIPEGMRLEQIFALLEEKGVAPADDLRETAATYDFKFSFLKGVLPLGDASRLEGYLFPDTYEFYMGEDPVSALNKMILRFDGVFNDDMRQQAADMGMSVHDIVTIASMIEKETDGEDQRNIASVIYNRLLRPNSETAGYLNIDATIAYVTGRVVTQADYQGVDSPYNTYTHQGLPPGPIASPGAKSLRCALDPASTSYYFYVLGPDGKHHFTATSAEHDRLVKEYQIQNAN